MQKSLLLKIRLLFLAVVAAGMMWSCMDEKPEIEIPVVPKETKYLETLSPDTLTYIIGDTTIVINFRTIPSDLPARKSTKIEVETPAGYVDSLYVSKDGVWSVQVNLFSGFESGDEFRLKVIDPDTTMYTRPVILQRVDYFFDILAADTISFKEGQYVQMLIRTAPYDLPSKKKTSFTILNYQDSTYQFAGIKSIQPYNDYGTWQVTMRLEYGMQSGDEITLMMTTKDTVMYSKPVVLNMIKAPRPGYYAINVVSDSVSAYEDKGMPTVRFRTVPWDALLENMALVSVADSMYSIYSSTFMPDSSWMAKIAVKDYTSDGSKVAFALEAQDTTVYSDLIELKKVAFGMTSARSSGKSMSIDQTNRICTYNYSGIRDLSNISFVFEHDGDKLTYGDSILADQLHHFDAWLPFKVTVWKYDICKEYTIRYKMTNTNLPVVCINTNNQEITSRKDWLQNIEMSIHYPDGTLDYEGTLQIRGRGNGTWVENENFSTPAKKPYALKLDEKAKILGMPKDKRWILLANYKDRTLLRNDAAYFLSRQTDMPYTIRGQFVELVLNGKHHGNYYLCEQVKVDNNRLNIKDPDLENPKNGGLFLEIDTYFNYYTNSKWPKKEELGFKSDYFRVPYIFKDPDETQITSSSATYTYVKNYINNLEASIMDDTRLQSREYAKYMDVGMAVDFLLIQELTMNNDSYNTWPSNGPHSTFIYMDSCGKLCFGPVWDFDYHTFTLYDESGRQSSRLSRWELLDLSSKNNQNYYFNRLKKETEFKRAIIDEWDKHKNDFKKLPDYLRTMADKIRLSEAQNYNVWGAIYNPNGNQNGDQNLSFQESIDAMIEAFNKRWDWMETKVGYYRNDINYH